jgi:hypothetical protein
MRDFTKFDDEGLDEIARQAEEKTDELIRITKQVLAEACTNEINSGVAERIVKIARSQGQIARRVRSFRETLRSLSYYEETNSIVGDLTPYVRSYYHRIDSKQRLSLFRRDRDVFQNYQNPFIHIQSIAVGDDFDV